MTRPLDSRFHPHRADLAALYLKGRVQAARFQEPLVSHIVAPIADMRRAPSEGAPLDTQCPFGWPLHLYEDKEGWCWVQALYDSYTGYIKKSEIGEGAWDATHKVSERMTLLYQEADAKAEPLFALGMGSYVKIFGEKNGFYETQLQEKRRAWIPKPHLLEKGETITDSAGTAEKLLGVPYFWGGRDPCRGLDCSALIQLALEMAGEKAPRDSDMQEKNLGQALPLNPKSLRRGDLVFWEAHVGIMTDPETLLHANAHHMCAATEPLCEAEKRILPIAGAVRAYRRL